MRAPFVGSHTRLPSPMSDGTPHQSSSRCRGVRSIHRRTLLSPRRYRRLDRRVTESLRPLLARPARQARSPREPDRSCWVPSGSSASSCAPSTAEERPRCRCDVYPRSGSMITVRFVGQQIREARAPGRTRTCNLLVFPGVGEPGRTTQIRSGYGLNRGEPGYLGMRDSSSGCAPNLHSAADFRYIPDIAAIGSWHARGFKTYGSARHRRRQGTYRLPWSRTAESCEAEPLPLLLSSTSRNPSARFP
jgi:hypothetical protein